MTRVKLGPERQAFLRYYVIDRELRDGDTSTVLAIFSTHADAANALKAAVLIYEQGQAGTNERVQP